MQKVVNRGIVKVRDNLTILLIEERTAQMYTYQANLFELQGFTDPADGDIIETYDFRTMYKHILWHVRQLPHYNLSETMKHCNIRKNGEPYASVNYFAGLAVIATDYTSGVMFDDYCREDI